MNRVRLFGTILGLAVVMSFFGIIPVKAAGGDSGYIPPEETSFNMDIIGFAGAGMYALGIAFMGYGKFFKTVANKVDNTR